jgi:hypothetical protein
MVPRANKKVTEMLIELQFMHNTVFCIQLIFQSGFNQTCTYGNIALDDIELFYTPCESTGTTQYQPHTPLTISTTKTAEDTTRSPCVTDMPVPTATKDPNPLPITPTKNPTITAKPPIQDFTIFPPDFLKPSSLQPKIYL